MTNPAFSPNRRPALLCCLLASLALSACAGKPDGGSGHPGMIQPITNAQQMDDVIALLADGHSKKASKRLEEMLKRDPMDRKAARLLESINSDPVALLGERNFQYRAQAGDSMAELAQRYLGDRLKFYALSRYNGVSVPSSMKAGQIIRIPGERPPLPQQRDEQTASPRSEQAPSAQKSSPPKQPAVDARQVNRLRSAGLAALNQGKVARSVVLLRQAAALDPGNSRVQDDLATAERILRTVSAKK